MWWKQNKWKVIVPVIVVAVLVIAFWFGGNSPGSRGWTVDPETPAPTQSETVTLPTAEVPSETESSAPQETASPAPAETRPGGDKGGMSAQDKMNAAEDLAKEPPGGGAGDPCDLPPAVHPGAGGEGGGVPGEGPPHRPPQYAGAE